VDDQEAANDSEEASEVKHLPTWAVVLVMLVLGMLVLVALLVVATLLVFASTLVARWTGLPAVHVLAAALALLAILVIGWAGAHVASRLDALREEVGSRAEDSVFQGLVDDIGLAWTDTEPRRRGRRRRAATEKNSTRGR
jgi:hypothetical protein